MGKSLQKTSAMFGRRGGVVLNVFQTKSIKSVEFSGGKN